MIKHEPLPYMKAEAGRRNLKRVPPVLLLFCLLSAGLLAGWPVDVLEVKPESGAAIYSAPIPLGRELATKIIHSVQLTPVIDIYRVQQGKIWGWRELIQSHNAGLPSLKPERGRFFQLGAWMVLEGAQAAWPEIFYRVGNRALGANELYLPETALYSKLELWRSHPGQRLSISAHKTTLLKAEILRTDIRSQDIAR